MGMNSKVLKLMFMALAAACLPPAAYAQGAAFEALLGAAGQAGLSASVPAVSAPRDTNFGGEFAYVDRGHVVPREALRTALSYYKAHRAGLGNPYYLSIADFTQYDLNKRFYVVNMRTGDVRRFLVAHGSGSDPGHTGYATIFSNKNETHATALGFYRTGETYYGEHGYSLRLDGLSAGNSNARARAIVIHAASYVASGGRSWGCLAVEPSQLNALVGILKGGSLIYAYHSGYAGAARERAGAWDPQPAAAAPRDAYAGASEEDGVTSYIQPDSLPENLAYEVRQPAEQDPGAPYYDSSAVRSATVPSGVPYRDIILKISREEGVDPALVMAVIRQESRFYPKARSASGALGLMQVMPATARLMGVKDSRKLYDPETNIRCGVRYLKYLWGEFGEGDFSSLSASAADSSALINTIAAYNAGPGNVRKYGGVPPFRETRGYTANVRYYFGQFKAVQG